MSVFDAPFSDIPRYFRKELVRQIFDASNNSQNIQLVGIKGIGKSLALRMIDAYQEEIKKNVKVGKKVNIYLSDLGSLPDRSSDSILKFIFSKILGSVAGGADLTFNLQKYFDNCRIEGVKTIIIIDSFESVFGLGQVEVVEFLKNLYVKNSDLLTFVFSLNKEITLQSSVAKFGGSGQILLDKVIYFEAFDSHESEWFLNSLCQMGKIDMPAKDKRFILDSSGGYPACIKRIVEGYAAGLDIGKVVDDPRILSGLAYNFEMIKASVTEYLASNDTKMLQRYGITDHGGKFRSKAFESYINLTSGRLNNKPVEKIGDLELSVKLTASEFKILNYIVKNKDKVCDREEVIEFVWGNKANKGISDHALDQIVSRLRKKLVGSKIEIETLRGRGYRFTSSQ